MARRSLQKPVAEKASSRGKGLFRLRAADPRTFHPWLEYSPTRIITTGPGCSSEHQNQSSEAFDYDMSIGTNLVSTEAGTITYANWDTSGFGYLLKIDHGGGWESLYGHMNSFAVSYGNTVSSF